MGEPRPHLGLLLGRHLLIGGQLETSLFFPVAVARRATLDRDSGPGDGAVRPRHGYARRAFRPDTLSLPLPLPLLLHLPLPLARRLNAVFPMFLDGDLRVGRV